MNDIGKLFVPAFLLCVVLVSAVGLVYSKHLSRQLFVELQLLNKQVIDLNTEWGQLQLEQSAWTDHGRIERIARERLNMRQPDSAAVVFIKP